MIPTECKMEDLSALEGQVMTLTANLVFGPGDKNISRRTALNRRLFVRLVDKGLDEYETARRHILAQLAEKQRTPDEMAEQGRVIYMLKFVDHMENCICTVRRILRLLNHLKGNQDGLEFPRIVRRQIDSLADDVVDMRNVVEHMDDEIQKDNIEENESVMIQLLDSQDGVKVAGESLKFSRLGTLLRRLHELSKNMAEWSAESSEKSSA
ncbi:hypothetical protein Nhal_1279 [Nitrosococcus halophilus Nc 4]|uniref:Uncharacterized protein n=2 Tax=Nitrosococcus halophilus TaxID=133539 RepID=D5C0A7_NITHN|nr:hypothetical protein Nhal_1279 [Nitrosococcus halophilus Nc 4]